MVLFFIPDFIIIAFMLVILLPFGMLSEHLSVFTWLFIALSFLPVIFASVALGSGYKQKKRGVIAAGICEVIWAVVNTIIVYFSLKEVFVDAQAGDIRGFLNGVILSAEAIIGVLVLFFISMCYAGILVQDFMKNKPFLVFISSAIVSLLSLGALGKIL